MINWILKQIFYLKFLWLKRGNDESPHSEFESVNLLTKYFGRIETFYSRSFEDLQWNRFLPWHSEQWPYQDWNTYGKFKQQYGRFFFKVKLDGLVTNTSWPAIWLLEISNDYYFEIDIELLKNDLSYTIHVNQHGRKNETGYHVVHSKLRSKKLYRELQKDFHLYLIDWNEKRIKFYIDGILAARFRNEIHKPMQIILSHVELNSVIVEC